MKYTVYKLTSLSNKIYIGYTSRPLKKRLNDHSSESKKNIRKIHKAILKYPIDTWKVDILFNSENQMDALQEEIRYIKLYNAIDEGYNHSIGGEHGSSGIVRSEETKKKISQSKKGIKHSKEWCEAHANKLRGRPRPESQKQSVSEKVAKNYEIIPPQGRPFMIKNLSKFCKENNLHIGNMSSVAYGRLPHHKGYKCKLLNT